MESVELLQHKLEGERGHRIADNRELRAEIAQLHLELAQGKYRESTACGYCSHSGVLMLAEIERLQAIVDTLPKTADGVVIVPGATVWQVETSNAGRTWQITDRQTDPDIWPFSGWCKGRCYSTREAAEKAPELQSE